MVLLVILVINSIGLGSCYPGKAIALSVQETPPGKGKPSPNAILSPDLPTPTRYLETEALIATYTPQPSALPSRKPFPPEEWQGVLYITQPGDTLEAVARRYQVNPERILSETTLKRNRFLIPGQALFIPSKEEYPFIAPWLLPDSEVVFGPSSAGFSTYDFLARSQGSLKNYQEWLESSGWTSSAQVIERVAIENSINPRLLITLLDWECGCLAGGDTGKLDTKYVLGIEDYHRKSLYGQLSWMARSLADGYYGWRSGYLPEDFNRELAGSHFSPDLNAGTVALLLYFIRLKETRETGSRPVTPEEWELSLDIQKGVSAHYSRLFGDPWFRDQQAGPLLPVDLAQPEFILPFEPGKTWSFTSGPHPAWENAGALSALDFAPATDKSGCQVSPALVLAVANGPVVRSNYGIVVQDIESKNGAPGDGYEGSGWAVIYLHIDKAERVPEGTYLHAGDPVGHPSCEGGPATGTHLHIARKYNGEWIAAAGPIPFNLEGWIVLAGEKSYQGHLVKDNLIITANIFGIATSWISRPKEPGVQP
jgi:LysM repeat protein